jgi:hypothetical protein
VPCAVLKMGGNLVVATMILVCSLALCLFYIHTACQSILRREFDMERLKSIVNANSLEFVFVRNAMEESDGQVDYPWVQTALKCDYQALTFLLKNALGTDRSYSRDEQLLMVYFRTLSLWLTVSHMLRLNEKRSILKLATILRHFATMIGDQVGQVRLVDLNTTEYATNT